jgi:hypothetical protein
MPSRSSVLLVVSGYLSTAALGTFVWRGLRAGALPPVWELVLCLAPAVIYLALAWRTRELPQFVATSAASFGLFPVLLLVWGTLAADDTKEASSAVETADPAAPAVDLFRLFTGAQSVRDLPMGHGGIEIMRRAVFADDSELTFYRFNNVTQAEVHLEFLQRAQRGSPATVGGRAGVRLAPDAERFVYVEKHGRELVQVEAANEAAVLARLQAQHVAPPAPTEAREAQASLAPAPTWPFTFSYALVHAVAFMGFWVWTHRQRHAAAAAGI